MRLRERMSPESVTPLFPDRPIRPLPKRRLRERLSPDAADSIEYPPAPQTTSALFSYPCNLKGGGVEDSEAAKAIDQDPCSSFAARQTSRRHGLGLESDSDEAAAARRSCAARPAPETSGRSGRLYQKAESSRHGHPQTPPSTTSSADGYDSFENTNNKKKRKIPTAGEINGGHGLNDTHAGAGGLVTPATTPGDRSGDGGGATSTPYYGSGSYVPAGQNVSGPGRGRYGRSRNGRSPLRTLSDTSGNWAGRSFKMRPAHPAQSLGIISNAIANAEKLPLPSDQENISLLHLQQQSAKSGPASASTQFTFTCNSQVPGSLAWPGSDPKSSNMSSINQNPAAGNSSQSRATQTQHPPGAAGAAPTNTQDVPAADSSLKGEAPQSTTSGKKTRRKAAKDLQVQAKKRRDEMARQNYHDPPKPEDRWICEFCEYERIFGCPPVALIRQYEIKDRKLRQQEEERRRVWEKAKARSRKGKKGSKMPAKNSNVALTQPADTHPAPSPPSNSQSQGTQSEEYYEDDFEGDPEYEVDDLPPHLVAELPAHGRGMRSGVGGGRMAGATAGGTAGGGDEASVCRPGGT